jgi:hypothetical protein
MFKTRREKGGEGDLSGRGEDRFTMRHYRKGKSWSEVKRMARDRTRWRRFVDALCPIGDSRR